MISIRRRLAAPILLSISSLITVITLLRNPELTTHLTKIPNLGQGFWEWGFQSENEFADGVRLVVFGDSLADSKIEKGREGKGKSWTDILCAELNCTSNINFAKSQPWSSNFPELPTGVVASNKVQERAVGDSKSLLAERANLTLPDLTTQIQSFIALPPPIHDPREIIFVVSVGFWDVYHFAGLDLQIGSRSIDLAVMVVISQLDILYSHFQKMINSTTQSANTTNPPPTFRLIIPKLVDPSLLPGWQTQRPVPIPPSSVAEQQKNAVHLTSQWNSVLERRLHSWINSYPELKASLDSQTTPVQNAEKEIFYHDLPSLILDLVIERSLEIEGLTDETGLGKSESPLVDVNLPCVSEEEMSKDDAEAYTEINGKMVCKSPRTYLWWDGWSLGGFASEEVGKNIAAMVVDGDVWGSISKKEI